MMSERSHMSMLSLGIGLFLCTHTLGDCAHILEALWTARNRKREGSSWALIFLGPEAAMMSLNDRATERQSDTHTALLRRVEGFEQPLKIFRIDAAPAILHAQSHTIVSFPLSTD